jgi:hypothetical protein
VKHNQRCALALIGGRVWVAWASHGDNGPYHGWLMGYDTADLTKAPIAWSTTPDSLAGGIWMGASGPSTDADGFIYVASGNGGTPYDEEDARTTSYGLSALKLRVDGDHIVVVDSFTAHATAELNAGDLDFGSVGAIILPDQTGPVPHRILTAAKDGTVYVLNRDDMGGFSAGDRVFQSFSIDNPFFIANPVFFDNKLFVCPHKSQLTAYAIDPATGLFASDPVSWGSACDGCFARGSTPSISSNGNRAGIVWILDNSAFQLSGPAILHAYDASDLTEDLYDSSLMDEDADDPAPAVKFTTPVVANGRVYVGGQGAVTVFGLRDAP